MRMLFDCHTFDVGPQGTTTFLAGLLNALPAASREVGREATILCAAQDTRNIGRFVTAPYHYRAMRGGFFRRNLLSLPAMARKSGTDIMVSQYVRPFRSQVPTVCVMHDVLFLDYPALFSRTYRISRQLMFGWSARNSDVVITVSDYSRNRIAKHFDLPLSRIDVLPNGVDIETPIELSRHDAAILNGPVRLLYVSRFETRKRQEWCLAASNALASTGRMVELTFVGSADGKYADYIRAQIAGNLAPNVKATVRSNVSAHDLDTLFADTDVFLFPSECEGFGIPVIEAAARGIPCVVADNTALTELSGRYAGIAAADGTQAGFVNAVVFATDQLPSLRREARARAGSVREAYRWPRIASDFVDILRRRGFMQ